MSAAAATTAATTAVAVAATAAFVRGAARLRTPPRRRHRGHERTAARRLHHAAGRVATTMGDRRARCAVVVLTGLVAAVLAPAATAIAVVAAALLPQAVERVEAAAARRRSDRALPEVLDAVARSLRSGASLGQAIADVRPPADAATARTWARLVASAPAIGVREAAGEWSARAATPHERLAAAALGLAAGIGGPQARAIDAAANAVRHRIAVDDEVRTQAVQARASTVVIGAAPVAFAAITAAVDRRFAPFLFGTAPGAVLLHLGIGLDALGIWWMARLVRRAAR